VDEDVVKKVNVVLLYIGQPALIISSVLDTELDMGFRGVAEIFLLALVMQLVLLALAYILTPVYVRDKSQRGLFKFMTAFGNTGFMGFPVIEAALGSLGLFHSIGFNAAFTILTWTLGLRLFSAKEKGSWKQMLNPGLIASVLGVLLYALDIRLPVVLNSSLNYIQQITTPLSMLVTGAYMSRITRSVALDKQMWFSCSLRLIVYPLLTFALMLLVPISVVQKNMFFITMMMPCASVTVIQALAYGTDESARMATGGVALSTILSAATIPLLLQLMPLMH